MLHWGAICSSSVYVPPHSSQLKDLIPIQTAEHSVQRTVIRVEEKSKDSTESDQIIRIYPQTIPFFEVQPLSAT